MFSYESILHIVKVISMWLNIGAFKFMWLHSHSYGCIWLQISSCCDAFFTRMQNVSVYEKLANDHRPFQIHMNMIDRTKLQEARGRDFEN